MSTVGYGDVYPITPIGQVIGSVVSFLSMIFLAMPLTIIVSSFSKTYKDSKKGGSLFLSLNFFRCYDKRTYLRTVINVNVQCTSIYNIHIPIYIAS